MSNVDFDPTDFGGGGGSAADYILGQRQAAQASTIGAVLNPDTDPEAAARAVELSKHTGVPASVINLDVPNFEANHRAAITAEILRNNDNLRRYINSDPMAPLISHDDLPQLDAAFDAADGLHPQSLLQRVHSGLMGIHRALDPNILPEDAPAIFGKGFGQFSPEAIQRVQHGLTGPDEIDWALRHPAIAPYMGVAGQIFGAGQLGMEAFARTIGGMMAVGHETIQKNFGTTAANDFAGIAEWAMTRGDIVHPEAPGPAGPKVSVAPSAKQAESIGRVLNFIDTAEKYAAAGREPGVGVHPYIDEIKQKEVKQDSDAVKEMYKTGDATATQARSPDQMAQAWRTKFADQHGDPEREIGIDAAAIQKLYGDKHPTPDDNLLGWIPDLKNQMDLAVPAGDKIQVPLADWLAHTDPEVRKTLHDDLQFREGGITNNEIEGLKDQAKTSIADPTTLVRAEGGFEPQFALGDRKLQLLKKEESTKTGQQLAEEHGLSWEDMSTYDQARYDEEAGGQGASHQFDINDETGKKVGDLQLRPLEDGKSIFIDWIGGLGGRGPQDFGPSLTRDIWRQLKAEYPDAERVGGYRVSGARDKAGKLGVAWVKFDEAPEGWSHVESAQEILQGAWEPRGGGRVEILKPHEQSLDYQHLTDAIQREAQRLVPRMLGGVETGAGLRRTTPGAPAVRGMYQRFINQLPQILVSLDEPDLALGVLRHEAIHHLRRYGFFNEGEWSTLTQAAKDEKWQEKYLGGRYKGLGEADRLEESVAEAFRIWKDGQTMPEGVHAIFEKLKQFIESIKTSFKELAGKDLNWEEIFRKVDTGEIGGREGTVPLEEGGRRPFDVAEMARHPLPEAGKLNRREEPGGVKIYDTKDWKLVSPGAFGGDWKLLDRTKNELRYIDETYAKQIMRGWNKGKRTIDEMEAPEVAKGGPDFEPLRSEREPGLFDKGKDMGITQAHMQNMHKRLDEENAANLKKNTERALKQKQKTLTAEYKERRITMRDEVREQLEGRPDIATDALFSKQKIKLHPATLSEEQKARLPKDYIQIKDGVNPDDLAPYMGYASGDALVDRLSLVTEDRKRAGMTHRDYVNRLIDVETDRRMNQEFGNLSERIMQEGTEQALADSTINRIHEETLLYGTAAGAQAPLKLNDVKAGVKADFDKLKVRQVKSARMIQNTGAIGRKIEAASAAGKWSEAYQLMQQRLYSTIRSKMAVGFEKSFARFERDAKTMGKAEVKSVEPEYLNHIKNIFQQLGYPGRRSARNVKENLERRGQTLQEFADSKRAETFGARDIPIADILQDPNFRADPKDLTVEQFNDIQRTLDALIRGGRDEQKIILEGNKFDKDQLINEAVTQLETFKERKMPAGYEPSLRKHAVAGLTSIPTIMRQIDRLDPRGLLTKLVTYPLMNADGTKFRLEREATEPMKVVYKILREGELDKKIDTPPMPLWNKHYSTFTNENLYMLVQHHGNEGNWRVAAEGYGADPVALSKWLQARAPKEIWDNAQKIGDTVWQPLVKKGDNINEEINGHTVDKIPLKEFTVTHPDGTTSTYPGWYHPLVPDANVAGKQKLKGGMDQNQGFGIATASGWRTSRTGAVYPLELSFKTMPTRVNQMIHDIAYRIPIMEIQKIFRDPRFANAMTLHWGKEYSPKSLLLPMLEGLAGQATVPAEAWRRVEQASEYIRGNTVGTLVGGNPLTIPKHGLTAFTTSLRAIGVRDLAEGYHKLFLQSPEVSKMWRDWMRDTSDTYARRERHFEETLGATQKELYGESTLREKVLQWGSWGIAQSDKFSAGPLWLGRFLRAMEENPNFGEARDIADNELRMQHGDTGASNQPLFILTKGGAFNGWLTSFYNLTGQIFQRQLDTVWKANNYYKLGKDKEIMQGMRKLPDIGKDLMTYVFMTGVIGTMVASLPTKDKRSWPKFLLDAFGEGAMEGIPFVRDLAHPIMTGGEPGIGLFTTVAKDFEKAIDSAYQGTGALNKQHAAQTVENFLTMAGVLKGVPPKVVARTARYGINVGLGREDPFQTHPDDTLPAPLGNIFRGVTTGTQKERVVK